MSNLLEVSDLNVAFRTYGFRYPILKNVTLRIPEGGRVALIGETGSGKSITAKTIVGTLPASAQVESGKICFRGEDVLSLPRAKRDALKGTAFSVILQDPMSSFNPVFTIGTHLEDVMRAADKSLGRPSSTRDRRRRIFDVLRRVQLADPERIFNSYPTQLSGGMRQRVLIALALLHQPALLIADEPGTALDVTTQDEIMRLISQLVDESGLSFLMITHNLGIVRKMADEIYVMCGGQVVEHGPLSQLFSQPRQIYTKQLIDAVPRLYGSSVVDQAPAEGDCIVQLSGVSKVFTSGSVFGGRREHVAVNNVSLSIRAGEIFGLAGESGSGKTTVARIVMGLIAPTEGSVKVEGKTVQRRRQKFSSRIQIVYQNPGTSLNPKRTVGQALDVPLTGLGLCRSAHKQRSLELLRQVDLPESFLQKYPHELSGGQKQRVAIARALAADPQIIVLDEPTSALDVSVQKNVIALLMRLRAELGLTYIFISHDLSLMRNFCSQIAVMFRGEIVETGTPKDLFADPRHPYSQALISAVPVISDDEEKLKPKIADGIRKKYLVEAI